MSNSMTCALPVPAFLVPDEVRLDDVEDAALELYARVAEADARLDQVQHKLREELGEQARALKRLIALLASERFEFDRLMRRIGPELMSGGMAGLMESLQLYARGWDMRLNRMSIQVVDLAGYPLSDDLVNDLEVESHVHDPSIRATTIRETLVPQVFLEGKSIGMAKVIAAVPSSSEDGQQ